MSGHKAGPDYIDPGYHAVATGRPGRNLDPVLCGEGLMAPLLAHGASGADIAVIEGVMGLFDGVASDGPWGSDPGFGSTAHLAALLDAPVVLVVDAAAAGRSVAALVAGFAGFDPRTRLAGVILNRVGSDRHEHLLRQALAALPDPVPVLGAIRRTRTSRCRPGTSGWSRPPSGRPPRPGRWPRSATWSRPAATWPRWWRWPGPRRRWPAAPWDPAVALWTIGTDPAHGRRESGGILEPDGWQAGGRDRRGRRSLSGTPSRRSCLLRPGRRSPFSTRP